MFEERQRAKREELRASGRKLLHENTNGSLRMRRKGGEGDQREGEREIEKE